jgi:hypothetical protein
MRHRTSTLRRTRGSADDAWRAVRPGMHRHRPRRPGTGRCSRWGRSARSSGARDRRPRGRPQGGLGDEVAGRQARLDPSRLNSSASQGHRGQVVLDTSQHLGAPMATEFVIVGTWVGVANAEFFHVDVIWCRRPSPRSLVSGSDRRVSRTDGSSSGPRSRGEEQGLRAQPGDTSRRSGLTAVVAAPSRGLACRATGLPVTNHVSAGRIQGGWTRPCRLARYRRTCASRLLHGHRS